MRICSQPDLLRSRPRAECIAFVVCSTCSSVLHIFEAGPPPRACTNHSHSYTLLVKYTQLSDVALKMRIENLLIKNVLALPNVSNDARHSSATLRT